VPPPASNVHRPRPVERVITRVSDELVRGAVAENPIIAAAPDCVLDRDELVSADLRAGGLVRGGREVDDDGLRGDA
jgi:hypothetical protein